MITVTRDGVYNNNRNSTLYNEIKEQGYNTLFFTKPSKKEDIVTNPFSSKPLPKKDPFISIANSNFNFKKYN